LRIVFLRCINKIKYSLGTSFEIASFKDILCETSFKSYI